MDEIEWMKHTKKALIFIGKFILSFLLIIEIAGLVGYFKNPDANYFLIISGLFLSIGIGIMFLEIMIFFILFLIHKFIYSGGNIEKNQEEYIREIPKEYPPAIVSLLYDLKIDVYKDYSATILNLYLKKYIDIVDYTGTTSIVRGINTDFINLQNHEKYVYNCLIEKNPLDENKFKKFIIIDCQKLKLITDKKENKILKVLFLLSATVFILFVLYDINKLLFFVFLGIVLTLLLLYFFLLLIATDSLPEIVDTNYKRTNNGKMQAKRFSAFKNFIKEYTLIAEKDLNYTKLLKEYIPYALSLDEATTIEKHIINNEIYRNLIYNR